MSLLILSATDVAAVAATFAVDDLTALAATVFTRLRAHKDFVLPRRTLVHADAYKTLFMPSRLEDCGTSIKIVSIPTGRSQNGLPATTLLLDETNGAVKTVVNARALTALRTAAGSLLASQIIGPSKPTTLVVFGAGKQSEAHIDLHVRKYATIARCTVINRSTSKQLIDFLAKLQSRFRNVDFQSCSLEDKARVEHIVASANIICTTTPSTKPLILSSWVKPGTHINLVGSYTPEMCEVDQQVILRAGRILVDYKESCIAEAGELIKSCIEAENLVEVGELLDHEGCPLSAPVSEFKAAGDITVFKSVGIGLMDTIIASATVDKALELGVGTNFALYD